MTLRIPPARETQPDGQAVGGYTDEVDAVLTEALRNLKMPARKQDNWKPPVRRRKHSVKGVK